MTIYTVYVKSPIAGTISGRANYCTDNLPGTPYPDPICTGSLGTHLPCMGWSNPVDVGGSGSLYLRVNYPNVRSIRTTVKPACCLNSIYDTCSSIANYRQVVVVDLYGGADGLCYYMGSVMYGHVASPAVVDKGLYVVPASGQILLGTVPSGSCVIDPQHKCFTAPHSHMEVTGGTVVAPCCGASVSGSTNIYKFTWSNNPPC